MPNKYQKIMEMLGAYPTLGTIQSLGPLSEEELDKIELQLGYVLPEDYRGFLRDYGGYEAKFTFPVLEEGALEQQYMEGFYGGNIAEGYYTQIRTYDFQTDLFPGLALICSQPVEKGAVGWPPELLPLAFDAVGNEICLALFGLRTGSIFLCRSFPNKDEQNVYLVADSFDEFMNLLRTYE